MDKILIYSFVLIVLCSVGCSSQYKFSDASNSASLILSGNTKHFYVEAYKDKECLPNPYGRRVAVFYGLGKNVDDHKVGREFFIPAGEEFVFTAAYIDAKPAQNRLCYITAGFVPEVGEKYRADFTVNEDVTDCRYKISRLTSTGHIQEPSAFIPKNLCYDGKNVGAINKAEGKPGRISYGVEVTDQYGRPL